MKKRIAAAALAAVLVCGIIGLRPKAVGLASAGVALGVLAFNLLGVMSGQYDDVAEGIGCFVESGVEGWQKAFVGSENTPRPGSFPAGSRFMIPVPAGLTPVRLQSLLTEKLI